MTDTINKYGIEGMIAPELTINQWVNGKGRPIANLKLSDFNGKFKVIYAFQSWCPGCHSVGLPSLQKMVNALNGNDNVSFFAIQTVFEGLHANTYKRMLEIQMEYGLDIPFGHDPGNENNLGRSTLMNDYRTGGTPWFIFIDQNNKVIFNDFHINTEKAIDYLKSLN